MDEYVHQQGSDDDFQKQDEIGKPDLSKNAQNQSQTNNEAAGEQTVYLSFIGTTQTFTCSIIGFGIISLPYSVKAVRSMTVTIITNIMSASILLLSTAVYIRVRGNMQKIYFSQKQPDQIEESQKTEQICEEETKNEEQSDKMTELSISDICFVLFGRVSIFMVNICLFISILGFNIMFFLFIAQTILSLFVNANLKDEEAERQYFQWKMLIILSLTIIQFPFSIKRQISQLSFQRNLQPIGLSAMLIILFIKIVTKEKEAAKDPSVVASEQAAKEADYLKWQQQGYQNHLLDHFNITISSYGFLVNLFPVYSKMHPKIRSMKNGTLSAGLALFLTMIIYLTFSQMSITYFGMENIHQNIFDNFSGDFDFLSQLLKVIFLIIFFCALPFNLHPLKICMLNLIEEVRSGRISKGLNSKLNLQQNSSQCQEDQYFDMEDEYNNEAQRIEMDKSIEDSVSETTHTIVVILMLSLIATLSMFVTDLTIVFGIIAAFSEAFINLILSGLFLLCTEYNIRMLKIRQSQDDIDDNETSKMKVNFYLKMILALMLTCIGVIHFSLSVRISLIKTFEQ